MIKSFLRSGTAVRIVLSLALLGAAAFRSAGDTLSSDLNATVAGTETATGSSLLAVSFGTDSSVATLADVHLLLANPSSGTAELALYSDAGLQPGDLLASLAPPGTYSASVSDTIFTSSGVSLAANTTYWIVLTALSGSFDWAWTADDTGSGVGFQDTWGISTDGGSTWFTEDNYPLQFSVDTATVTPEPDSLTMCFAGLFVLVSFVMSRRRYRKLMHEFEREMGERFD